MSSIDLKSWLELLKRNGELVEIEEEVDWKFEVGCLIRRIFDIPGGGPAVLFKNIKDYQYKEGRMFFAGSFSSYRRIALAMGLSPETPYKDIVFEYIKRIENPIPPVL